jgi:ferredoxin
VKLVPVVKRAAREKLLEAARRREIDVVLVCGWIAGAAR